MAEERMYEVPIKVWQQKRPWTAPKPFCTTYGIRTRDSSVQGRRLNPLTNAACPVWHGKDKRSFILIKVSARIFSTRHSGNDWQKVAGFQRGSADKSTI